jgi:GT2 family glycosyltransferase
MRHMGHHVNATAITTTTPIRCNGDDEKDEKDGDPYARHYQWLGAVLQGQQWPRRLAALVALLVALCAVLNAVDPAFGRRNARPAAHRAAVDRSDPAAASGPATMRAPSVGQCLGRGLLLRRHEHPAVARVVDDFACGCRAPDVYEPHETPTVCAIVQSYNHAANVQHIARALVGNPLIDEIIVCEDGSVDGSLDAWLEQLRDVRHFVILSNNLHETRCYNRAMRISSASFFVLLQDDDIPPTSNSNSGRRTASATRANSQRDALQANDGGDAGDQGSGGASGNWVGEALDLFRADPDLGLLSGFIGQLWEPDGTGYEFGEQQSDHGGLRKGPTRRIPFLAPATGHPFMYVECGWIAPLFIRAESLRRVGGLDIHLFQPGEPGVWQDCVLGYTAWNAGWRVGVYDAGFQRGVGGHGSTSSKAKADLRKVMWQRAKYTSDVRFERQFVHAHVLELNNRSLTLRYGGRSSES